MKAKVLYVWHQNLCVIIEIYKKIVQNRIIRHLILIPLSIFILKFLSFVNIVLNKLRLLSIQLILLNFYRLQIRNLLSTHNFLPFIIRLHQSLKHWSLFFFLVHFKFLNQRIIPVFDHMFSSYIIYKRIQFWPMLSILKHKPYY